MDFGGLQGKFDVFAKKNRLERHLSVNEEFREDCEDSYIHSLLAKFGWEGPYKNHFNRWCKMNEFNVLRDWIRYVKWDGTDHIDRLYQTLDLPDDGNDYKTLLKRWLLQCCSVWTSDIGGKAEMVPVLYGSQGVGKTTWVKNLLPQHPMYVEDGFVLDGFSKDSQLIAIQHALVEFGEIGRTTKGIDFLKAFLSKPSDTLRLPYAERANTYHRRTCFAGSVDRVNYLRDDAGNRRFLTLPVGNGMNAFHNVNMQQCFAQCYALLMQGERGWLNQVELGMLTFINGQYIPQTTLEAMLLENFDPTGKSFKWMTPAEILLAIGRDRDTAVFNPQVLGNLLSKERWFDKKAGSRGTLYHLPEQKERFYS